MSVYYCDNDPKVAAWLQTLTARGHLPAGYVHSCPIQELEPNEISSFTQCHFFAGIGGWPLALRLAGWPEDRPVWTGSCPCQPFSTAGQRRGTADARHLWPVFASLIDQCRPPVIFGEQVASRLGREWFAGVRADLEAMGYAVGAADLCAAGVAAPHIRQRLYWVAYTNNTGSQRRRCPELSKCSRQWPSWEGRIAGRVAHANIAGQHERLSGREQSLCDGVRTAATCWLSYELVPCRDGKSRRIEPGSFPLAHGVPARVVRLRGYGNAIVPQVAEVFVRAFLDVEGKL